MGSPIVRNVLLIILSTVGSISHIVKFPYSHLVFIIQFCKKGQELFLTCGRQTLYFPFHKRQTSLATVQLG